jgi:hypothetical protein
MNNDNAAAALGKKTMPPAALSSKTAMIDTTLDVLPEWCYCDSTRKSMTRHERKNLTQAHLACLTGQVEKCYYYARYSAGYKTATLVMQSAAGTNKYITDCG